MGEPQRPERDEPTDGSVSVIRAAVGIHAILTLGSIPAVYFGLELPQTELRAILGVIVGTAVLVCIAWAMTFTRRYRDGALLDAIAIVIGVISGIVAVPTGDSHSVSLAFFVLAVIVPSFVVSARTTALLTLALAVVAGCAGLVFDFVPGNEAVVAAILILFVGLPLSFGNHRIAVARQKLAASMRDAEAFQREKTHQIERMAANSPGAIFQLLANADGVQIPFLSPKAGAIFGLDVAAMQANPTTIWSRIHHLDRNGLAEMIRAAQVSKGSVQWQGRIEGSAETHVIVRASSERVEGGLIIWDGIVLDVTEQVAAQRAKDAERAAMVASNRLTALGEMAGNIAHEINNPLAIIHGRGRNVCRELDRDAPRLEKVREFAESIVNTAERIESIVRGMKALTRNAAGDPLRPERLARIVSDSIDLCRERLHSHDVELRVAEIDPELIVMCRAAQICQVLVNLLNNAFDAISTGPDRWIAISLVVCERRDSFEIRVVDSGHGLPAHVQNNLMTPFFTTKEPGKGTGLGLSVSRRILEEHGGDISLQHDAPNTTFVVTIPRPASVDADQRREGAA